MKSLRVIEFDLRDDLFLLALFARVFLLQLLLVFNVKRLDGIERLQDARLPVEILRRLVTSRCIWHFKRRLVQRVVLAHVGL